MEERGFPLICAHRGAVVGPRLPPLPDITRSSPTHLLEAHRGAMEAQEERGIGVPACGCVRACYVGMRTRACAFKIRV